jgi:hypothetical protein
VQEVLTGYQRGSEALALPGEPRPEYAPGSPKLRRCEAKAAELGVSVMTVRRMIWRFEAGGPEGLIDQRGQRRNDPLAGVDPRWLDMARQVLAEHAQASKPTQDLVLAEVAARLDAEHGDGAVPVPKPTRARALLREITRGTFAFGGTKAKREIAGRPAAPYGRLRAMRPGEYLLLDTTRLDVFAMDPVTLRWVQCELTIAMDLYDRCVTGLRLTPVSTKAVDAAAVLFESVRPLPEPAAGHADDRPPYHGLPSSVVIDAARLATQERQPHQPGPPARDHRRHRLAAHQARRAAHADGLRPSLRPRRPPRSGVTRSVPEKQERQSRNVTQSATRDCSLTRQPARRELFNYNEKPSSRCSSSRDPYRSANPAKRSANSTDRPGPLSRAPGRRPSA